MTITYVIGEFRVGSGYPNPTTDPISLWGPNPKSGMHKGQWPNRKENTILLTTVALEHVTP